MQTRTGVVFPQRRQLVEDGAVWEHDLEAEDGAVKRSVPQKPKTAGVGGDVAANMTTRLCDLIGLAQGGGHTDLPLAPRSTGIMW